MKGIFFVALHKLFAHCHVKDQLLVKLCAGEWLSPPPQGRDRESARRCWIGVTESIAITQEGRRRTTMNRVFHSDAIQIAAGPLPRKYRIRLGAAPTTRVAQGLPWRCPARSARFIITNSVLRYSIAESLLGVVDDPYLGAFVDGNLNETAMLSLD